MSASYGKRTTAQELADTFPDQIKGRTVIVTGPSLEGIGYSTARALASKEPKEVILAARSMSKLEDAQKALKGDFPSVKTRLLQIDLSDMSSVRKAAKEINALSDPIDMLINNAAAMDTPYTLTKEGHELRFASNYLGPWLFTNSVLPKILSSTNKRIVMVASSGHANGDIRWGDPAFKTGYEKKQAYGQSKTGDVLYARELAKRYGSQGLVALSLSTPERSTRPCSNIGRKRRRWSLVPNTARCYDEDGNQVPQSEVWKTPEQGASTSIRAALDPTLADQNGVYMTDCQPNMDALSPHAQNPTSQDRLWTWTNELLGEKFE